jgi:hypothetical protein
MVGLMSLLKMYNDGSVVTMKYASSLRKKIVVNISFLCVGERMSCVLYV